MTVPAGPPTIAGSAGAPCSVWVDAAAVAARPDIAVLDPAPDLDLIAANCLVASALLYTLSGRKYPGVCTATVRPYEPLYGCLHVPVSRLPECGAVDSWMAATNGGICGDGGIDLGLYPVRDITEVKINGLVVDPSMYRVDGQRWLVRPDVLFWPPAQRLDLPDSADGTFSVTATFGADPPPTGVLAASKLAAELVKDATPNAKTSLPRRITNVTRQGVSITQVDPMAYLRDGLLGIWEADAFLIAENPQRQKAPPLIWSPELTRRRSV